MRECDIDGCEAKHYGLGLCIVLAQQIQELEERAAQRDERDQ
jgi:hypothetical protein